MDAAVKLLLSDWVRRLVWGAAGAVGWETYLTQDVTNAIVTIVVGGVAVGLSWAKNKLDPRVSALPDAPK